MSYQEAKQKWLAEHKNATLAEAWAAGYWQACDNWLNQAK